MSVASGGYPIELFLNTEHALAFQCKICGNVCRNPVQLNCQPGHIFCDECISNEPHTITIVEPIYYDANNNSNELRVNEDYSNQNQINVSTQNTTCPICKIQKCSRVLCPVRISEAISLLSIQCMNAHYGCKWNGTLSQLHEHTQNDCISTACNCPFHVFGCKILNVSKQELMTHFQTAQMEHLQLQISSITALQTGYQSVQNQLNTLNNQQVTLTTLITSYEQKLKQLNKEMEKNKSLTQSPMNHNDMNHNNNNVNQAAQSQQNLQFNINMNNNKYDIPIIDESDRNYHRWKNNPIIDKIVDIQKAIISTQSHSNTVHKIHKISNQYTLAEMTELYADINTKTQYLPTIHKKLCIIRGSTTKNTKHHSILAIDLHNKKKYKLCNNDSIIKYVSWDVEFCAFTVLHNMDSKIFQKVIRDQREQMLFSMKYGISIKNVNNNENKQNLESKYNHNEEKKRNEGCTMNNNCTILLRCGGSIVHSDNHNNTGATPIVNGLVMNTGDWISSLPSLKVPRYGATAVYSKHNGVLCVGGKDEKKCLNIVEQWKINSGPSEWDFIPNMTMARYAPCCAIFNSSNKLQDECLFVGGGWNKKDKVLKTCEWYNFNNGYWQRCAHMNVARYGSGCTLWNRSASQAQYASKIMVGGGYNKLAVRSVEEYDMHKDKWTALPNTNGKHRNAPALWVCKEYGKFLSPFHGLLCIAGDLWSTKQQSEGTIDGYIEMYDHRDWRQQWFIVEDLRNILLDNRDAIVRGIIPFA